MAINGQEVLFEFQDSKDARAAFQVLKQKGLRLEPNLDNADMITKNTFKSYFKSLWNMLVNMKVPMALRVEDSEVNQKIQALEKDMKGMKEDINSVKSSSSKTHSLLQELVNNMAANGQLVLPPASSPQIQAQKPGVPEAPGPQAPAPAPAEPGASSTSTAAGSNIPLMPEDENMTTNGRGAKRDANEALGEGPTNVD